MKVRADDAIRALVRLRAGGKLPLSLVRLVSESGALLQGHFRLQSGLHSPYFIRVSQLVYREDDAALIAELLAKQLQWLRDGNPRLVLLAARNASGYLCKALARELSAEYCLARVDQLRRPQPDLVEGEISKDDCVLVVADVITTGTSLLPLLELVTSRGASLVGLAAFLAVDAMFFTRFLERHDVRGAALLEAAWKAVPTGECKQCDDGELLLPSFEFN